MFYRYFWYLAVQIFAVVLTLQYSAAQTLFCMLGGGIGGIGFFILKPSVPFGQRLRMINKWPLVAIPLMFVYVTLPDLRFLFIDVVNCLFSIFFFCGFDLGVRLLMGERR